MWFSSITAYSKDVDDYLGEITMAGLISEEAREAALQDQRARQRSFLKRKATAAGTATWRPRKRHRRSAYQYTCHIHNQLQQFVPGGLKHFMIPDAGSGGQVSQWPRFSLSPDMGPDGVCAMGFWIHRLGVNVDAAWDFSHAVHNDVLNGYKEAGLMNHIVLSLIRLNIPVSPWQEDVRFQQSRKAALELFKNETPERCELFREFAPQMLREAAGSDLASGEDPEAELWTQLQDSNPFSTKGTKLVLGRYLGVVRKLREELAHFAQRKFFYLYVALEMDFVGSAKFARLLCDGTDIARWTNSHKDTAEESALRKACANQLVVGLMDMLSADCETKDKIVVTCCESWEQWFGVSNARLRSTTATLPWTQEQLRSKFAETCVETFGVLTSAPKLHFCDFVLPTADQLANLPREELQAREDEMATLMAHSVLCINSHRLRRCSWLLLGWSARSSLFTENTEEAKHEVRQLQIDHENFEHLRQIQNAEIGIASLVKRSCFQHRAVQQIYGVLKDGAGSSTDFNMFRITTAWLRERSDARVVIPKQYRRQACYNIMLHGVIRTRRSSSRIKRRASSELATAA